jgi:glucokinase
VVCGLDVGGTKLLASVFDPHTPGRWAVEERVPTPESPEELADLAADLVPRLVERAEVEHGRRSLRAVGVGIAGLVDRRGRLRRGPNLPGFVEAPVADQLSDAIGVPVRVENDATAAAWGEHRLGAGNGVADLLVVTLGTGIGAGVISGGRPLMGAHGFAGEAGHMIVDPNGPLCPCGQRGCWERFASGSGLGRLAREAAEAGRLGAVVAAAGGDADAVRGEHLTDAATAGDPEALKVIEAFARWVAVGLANLTNVLDPERIVIAGGLVAAGDTLLDPVREAFASLLFAVEQRGVVEIVPAALGERAGVVGAGLLGVERLG